ncbi:MAG: hypothetical protein HY926_03755 [Elusimicrobia bacterium]|nr:hypothetical protein [Elusimicrobiota bacterium]
MKEALQRLGRAKTVIDRGFSRLGPELKAQDEVGRALMLLSCRSVAVSNALMVLAQHNHANEALPLLRSLLELAVHMRWIAQDDSAARAKDFLKEHDRPQWDGLWAGRRLDERCAALGFPDTVRRQVQSWCRAHLWGNAAGLPWAHVFAPAEPRDASARDVLEAAAALMAEAVAALERRWPGRFPTD